MVSRSSCRSRGNRRIVDLEHSGVVREERPGGPHWIQIGRGVRKTDSPYRPHQRHRSGLRWAGSWSAHSREYSVASRSGRCSVGPGDEHRVSRYRCAHGSAADRNLSPAGICREIPRIGPVRPANQHRISRYGRAGRTLSDDRRRRILRIRVSRNLELRQAGCERRDPDPEIREARQEEIPRGVERVDGGIGIDLAIRRPGAVHGHPRPEAILPLDP